MVKRIIRPFQILYNIYAWLLLICILLAFLPFLFLTFFLPEAKRGNWIYRLFGNTADVFFFLIGIRHTNFYESPHPTDRPMIFVFNHISYLDALMLVKCIRRQPVRGLGKYEIAKVPLLGFFYKNAVIMVNRSDKADRKRSVEDLKKAIDQNISVALAPEGTFNETNKPLIDFYDGAFRIAIETQTPIKPILFLDTFDRLHYSSILSLNPGVSRVIFMKEFSVENYQLSDLHLLKQEVYTAMEDALIKYKASWIKS